MAEFPALPLFTDALVADTDHLDDKEFGLYMRILIHMWRSPKCRLPADNSFLARKFRRSVEDVEKQVIPLMQEYMRQNGNWYEQKRLLHEYEYLQKQRERNRDNANRRWNKDKDGCEGNAAETQSGNAPTPTPRPLIEAKASIVTLPDWIPNDAWIAYMEVRQRMRVPNTKKAIGLLVSKLTQLRDNGGDPQKIIEQSIERGWRSFFELKGDNNANPRQSNLGLDKPNKDDRARAAVLRGLGIADTG